MTRPLHARVPFVLSALAVVLCAGGIIAWSLLSSSGQGHLQPPRPPSAGVSLQVPSSGTTSSSPGGSAAGSPTTSPAATPLASDQASPPTRISIPALGVTSALGPARGLNPNGTVNDAPLTGPIWSLPWWYSGGPAPGEDGSAVILGHVDSAIGAGHLGTFYRLGDLEAGDTVSVTLDSGVVTHWSVVSDVLYADTDFPDSVVYDPTGPPMLRLVTCGGTYDTSTHEYEGAVVVTAELTSVAGA